MWARVVRKFTAQARNQVWPLRRVVPIQNSPLSGLDSLLSTVQMPGGIPVATFGIGKSGAKNAGLFAAAMLARRDPALRKRLEEFRAQESAKVPERP